MVIHEGPGWRLQLDPGRHPFSALIGGADWAVELSDAELLGLRRAVIDLQRQWRQLLPTLMPEERCDLELELELLEARAGGASGSLFVALSGEPRGWSLRFVLSPAVGIRAVEGSWSAAASPALAAALESLSLPGG